MSFKSRIATAPKWDIALFRLALSTVDLGHPTASNFHSVYCWLVARSPKCTCIDARMRTLPLFQYKLEFAKSTLVKDVSGRLVANRKGDFAQDRLDVVKFFVSLSEPSHHPTAFLPFIRVYVRLRFLFCCIDSCSAGLTTGFSCCSRTVPQTRSYTTRFGLSAQPRCQIMCQSGT